MKTGLAEDGVDTAILKYIYLVYSASTSARISVSVIMEAADHLVG